MLHLGNLWLKMARLCFTDADANLHLYFVPHPILPKLSTVNNQSIFSIKCQDIFCKRLQTSAWSILWEFYTNSLMERLSFLWSNLNSITTSLKVSTLFPGGPILLLQMGQAQNIAKIEVHFFACKAYSNKESLCFHPTRAQRELLHLSIMYKVPWGYFLWSDAV